VAGGIVKHGDASTPRNLDESCSSVTPALSRRASSSSTFSTMLDVEVPARSDGAGIADLHIDRLERIRTV
jgi:hypothetical protein